jgi:hypothetical protein
VIAREQERFERSIAALLAEAREDDPGRRPRTRCEEAVRRYLQLNPSTESYWTIVTFEDGPARREQRPAGARAAVTDRGTAAEGELNVRETIDRDRGRRDPTSSVPICSAASSSPRCRSSRRWRRSAPRPARPPGWSPPPPRGVAAARRHPADRSLWRSLTPLGALAAAHARPSCVARRPGRGARHRRRGRLLAREFNTMLDRLEQAASAQQEFMASIGHELRTPITIARGHLELLQTVDQDDPDAVDETVAIVQDELDRMGRLVEDLMAIARADMEDFVRPASSSWSAGSRSSSSSWPGPGPSGPDPAAAAGHRARPTRTAWPRPCSTSSPTPTCTPSPTTAPASPRDPRRGVRAVRPRRRGPLHRPRPVRRPCRRRAHGGEVTGRPAMAAPASSSGCPGTIPHPTRTPPTVELPE